MIDLLNKGNREVASAKLLADAFSLLIDATVTQEARVAMIKILRSREAFIGYLDNKSVIGIGGPAIITINSYNEALQKAFELNMNRHRDKLPVQFCKFYEEFVDDLHCIVMAFIDGMLDHINVVLTKLGCKNNMPSATLAEMERVHEIRKKFFGVSGDERSELMTRLIKFRFNNRPLSEFKEEDIFATIPLIQYTNDEKEIDYNGCDFTASLPSDDKKVVAYTNYFVEERNGINLLKVSLSAMKDILMHYPNESETISALVKIKYDILIKMPINEYIEGIKTGKINMAKDYKLITDNLPDIINLFTTKMLKPIDVRNVRRFLAGAYAAQTSMWNVLNPDTRSDIFGDKCLVTAWEAKLKVYEDNEIYVSSIS